jgi:class 3 adenylate cyclase/tetratricopeptide (TPR) repeat protein
MHQLVPSFILERYAAGELHGNFPAVGMFVDISGFSAMTDALMTHGQEGGEVLADIMRSVLDPLLESVYAQGGFVANSAGDAITVLFPITQSAEPAPLRALAAAWNLQQHMLSHAEYSTAYQTFNVSAKVGLAIGDVQWGILLSAKGHTGVYYFKGNAVDGCAEAEHQANAGEIILQAEFFRQIESVALAEPLGAHYRLQQVKMGLPPPQPAHEISCDPEIMAVFFPQKILTQDLSGEFRQVVNMFINLPSVRTETQLAIFIDSLFDLQEKYGGLLNRLDFGDKGTNLLLFWGAPTAFENDIERALNFILDLQMVTSLPISSGVTYRISHAGFIGGRLHVEYTCFGRGVNLAARFMTAASRGEIWVDEYIAERAAHHFEIEFVEERTFKGFQLPQKVFVLFERKEEEKPFFTGALSGREADLERLRQFVQPIFLGGYPGMLVVTGEPGIGKSRLVHDFLADLQSTGQQKFQIFLGQTDEILRQSLNPFKYWLQKYFSVAEAQGESRNKRNFNRKMDTLIATIGDPQLANELDRTRSFLGALVGLHWPDSLYEQLDAPGRYKNTFIALTTLLQAESLQTPVILLLEDIHWLDADSGTFLTQLGRILAVQENQAYPVAILATSRSGKHDLGLLEQIFFDLTLAGLPRNHLNTLAAQLLQSPPSEDLLNLLEQRAEGNPFYAEQILRFMIDGDLLVLDQGVWQIRAGQVDTLPIDVNVLLVARLDHLTQEVKEAVQTAAVLGREFEVNLLSYMLRKEDANPLPEIALAEKEAIWTALTELRYIFIHGLLRDAAYQMQVHTRRKALHSLALEAYEKLSGDSLAEHYGELAYHAEQAGLGEKARHYLHLAGCAALEAYQNEMAVDYFTRALALTPPDDAPRRCDLLMKREQVYLYLAKNAERERDLVELAGLLPELGDDSKSVEVLLRQSRLDLDLGQYAQADAYGTRAADLAVSIEELEKASVAFRYLASSSMRQGKLEQAANLARQSVSLARKCGSREEEGRAVNILGMIMLEQGKLEEAQEAFKHGLEITHETGDFRFLGAPLNNLGLVATQQWNYIEAQNYFQQALEVAQKIGERIGEAIALGNLGFISGSLGDYPRARLITERYLFICREVGNPYHESNALVNLSAWAIAQQDFEFAGQSVRQALQLSQSIGDRSGEAWALTYLGHSQFAQGKLDAAQQAYMEALSIRQELAQPELACEPVAGLARVALQRGDLSMALQHIDAILPHLERGGSLQGTDQPLRVNLICYQVLQQFGDPRASHLLETAYRILQERAAKIPDKPTRQAFLNNIEYHREIWVAYLKQS